jgi:hypothetical protein
MKKETRKKERLTVSPSPPSCQAQGEQVQKTGCSLWSWNTVIYDYNRAKPNGTL